MMRRLPASRLDKPVAIPCDLYFVQTQCAEKFIKIGVSSNVAVRVGKMQMDCPYPIKLLKLVPGMAYLEFELHRQFAADRVRGEWFRTSNVLLSVIDGLQGRHTFDQKMPIGDLVPLI